jgi:hypothetical protein
VGARRFAQSRCICACGGIAVGLATSAEMVLVLTCFALLPLSALSRLTRFVSPPWSVTCLTVVQFFVCLNLDFVCGL